jgi:hypothetical protein
MMEKKLLTQREAYQRCEINRVRMEKVGQEFRITLREWPARSNQTERKAYYTDDLEDAVLTGGMMRRQA